MKAEKLIMAIENGGLALPQNGGDKNWYSPLNLNFTPLNWERNLTDGFEVDVYKLRGRWKDHLYSINFDSWTNTYTVLDQDGNGDDEYTNFRITRKGLVKLRENV